MDNESGAFYFASAKIKALTLKDEIPNDNRCKLQGDMSFDSPEINYTKNFKKTTQHNRLQNFWDYS